MDTKTIISLFKTVAFALCVMSSATIVSCSTDNKEETNEDQTVDISAIEERRKAIELAYEYEQFVNKVWQDLKILSDDLTDLQVNKEVSAQTKRTKMASIEKNLKNIENRLKEAEENQTLRDSDRQRIFELHEAIKHKNLVIQKLKKENKTLRDSNTSLQTQLQQTDKALENTSQELMRKKYELEIKKQELERLRLSNAREVEELGDFLRKIVTNMEGVNGSGTLAPLKAGQIKLLEGSLSCYKKAYVILPSLSRKEKIERTENGLNIYRNSKDLSGLVF